jgi:tRNA pseudouridine32 synthase/23S rRNA pseudouridine746 synthase
MPLPSPYTHTINSPHIILNHPKLLAIHKPHGIPFHQTKEGSPGIMSTLHHLQQQSSSPDSFNYQGPLYPVHRLDQVTSGILLLAKDPSSANQLIQLFRSQKIVKYYVALADRKPKKKQGTIRGGMKKGRNGSWMLTRPDNNSNNSNKDDTSSSLPVATTRFISKGIPPTTDNHHHHQQRRPGLRAYLLKPETGKTHQLRVAMKSLGTPILGDTRYANAVAASQEVRTYLHCAAVRFLLDDGELIQIVHLPPPPPLAASVGDDSTINSSNEDEFNSLDVQGVLRGWFHDGLVDERGVWFGDESPLVQSEFKI